jgi:hypothetical protein
MQEDFLKIDEDAKVEKEALNKRLITINEQEFDLPTILIEIELPTKKTSQNFPLIPAKIMYAVDFFKDSMGKDTKIE